MDATQIISFSYTFKNKGNLLSESGNVFACQLIILK